MPMTKSRRALTARTSARSARKSTAKRAAAVKRRPTKTVKTETRSPTMLRRTPARPATAEDSAPAAPAQKPTYHEAVAMYERGLQALQRRDFAAAAAALRSVIDRYADERELLERARLYLKVCAGERQAEERELKAAHDWD